MAWHLFFFPFLLLLAINSALSARIAGFYVLGGSEYIIIRNMLEELAARGHEVALVVPSSQKNGPSHKVPHKIYQTKYQPGFLEDTVIPMELEGNKLQLFLKVTEVQVALCEDALNSKEVLKELKGFDLIVYDSFAICGALIGELLDIPRVEIMPVPPNAPPALVHMIPMPVSYVPQLITEFTDKMSFLERVLNLGTYLGSQLAINFIKDRPMNAVKVKYNIKPERNYLETVGNPELVLITADFALEYPQPLLPGQVMVGPLNVRDARPLPPDLEEFVTNSGGHGFIIVSFGSNVASVLPRTVVDMLATAFGKLKQRVVWRLKGYIPSSLGPNIKIVEWLPQNDLLAHKDIKAFVSHVGPNSLYEATYHGVPVVAFPLFADQHANARKAVHFGLGLTVDHKSTNSQQIFQTVEVVVTEPRFRAKAMHISSLLKDRRRSPLQEACDWIDYVLKHGGAQHLRPQVFNIPWYQYYLLDVMAFLVAVVTFVVIVITFTCRYLCRLCCQIKGGSKFKEE